MRENTVLKDLLIDDFEQLVASVNGQADGLFFQQQKEAFNNFAALGFPTPKIEEWKYSNVKNIVNERYTFNQATSVSDEDILSLETDRKSTRLNSSHVKISYAVFCLKKKNIRATINDRA